MRDAVNISETASKKVERRGRPRLDLHPLIDTLVDPSATHRTKQNVSYRQHALEVLHYSERRGDQIDYSYLFDIESMKAGRPNSCRKVVMAELGRIDAPEDLLFVAREVCKAPPRTTKQAVEIVRRMRLGERPDSDWYLGLAAAIENAAVSYAMEHGLSRERVSRVLSHLSEYYSNEVGA